MLLPSPLEERGGWGQKILYLMNKGKFLNFFKCFIFALTHSIQSASNDVLVFDKKSIDLAYVIKPILADSLATM